MNNLWKREAMVRNAALWIWYNQEKHGQDMWWSPDDLTKSNPDKSCLGLTHEEASEVFDSLLKRGLVRRGTIEFFRHHANADDTAHNMTVYYIERHKKPQWEKITEDSFWLNYVKPIFGDGTGWLKPLLILAVSSTIGGFFIKTGEALFLKAQKIIPIVLCQKQSQESTARPQQ